MAQMILTSSMNVFAANVKNQEQINNGVKVNLLNENCYIISAKGQMKRVTIVGNQVTLGIGEALVCPNYPVNAGQRIRVTWTLKQSGTIKVEMRKNSSLMESSIVTGPSGYKYYTADVTTNYSVRFTNAQSSPLTITGATMTWPA